VKLGENTVIEADKEAERIKAEALEQAENKGRIIIGEAEAEGQALAEKIVAESYEKARAEAERILGDAEQSTQQKISSIEQLSFDIINSARLEAEQRARGIVEQAGLEANKLKRDAEAVLLKSRSFAEYEIKLKFESIYREMLSVLEEPDEMQYIEPDEQQ
jgi:vacuolar-type H+-ATPase subunit H